MVFDCNNGNSATLLGVVIDILSSSGRLIGNNGNSITLLVVVIDSLLSSGRLIGNNVTMQHF
jgi:hypothetical protein